MTIEQTDEARMLERALQSYPLLAQRLSETDKAIVIEGVGEISRVFSASGSWSIGRVCEALMSPSENADTVIGKYVDKHIRPRLSNIPRAGEPWAPPLPRIIQ